MPQTILITGANRGIGLALVVKYLERGDKVYAVCRSSSDELDNTKAEVIEGIDVSQSDDINKLRKEMKGTSIDVLINNAGILSNESLSEMNFNDIEKCLAVNSIAPLHITHALLENLHAGSKIALITSRMGSIEDNGSGGYYGYRMSKAALNMALKTLSIEWKLSHPKGCVAALHPGTNDSPLSKPFQSNVAPQDLFDPQYTATCLVDLLKRLDASDSGQFWTWDGRTLPW